MFLAFAISLAACTFIAAPSRAASTRTEYVAQVELICKADQIPIAKSYFGLFNATPTVGDSDHPTKHDRRRAAHALGRFYTRISNLYGRTSGEIGAVPPAPGDETTIAAWLTGRAQAQALWLRAGRAARHLKEKRATRLVNRGIAASDAAARNVSTFGFHFCTFSIGDAEF
jgi:hypothetical protein